MVMQFPEMENLSYPYFDIATHHFTLPRYDHNLLLHIQRSIIMEVVTECGSNL